MAPIRKLMTRRILSKSTYINSIPSVSSTSIPSRFGSYSSFHPAIQKPTLNVAYDHPSIHNQQRRSVGFMPRSILDLVTAGATAGSASNQNYMINKILGHSASTTEDEMRWPSALKSRPEIQLMRSSEMEMDMSSVLGHDTSVNPFSLVEADLKTMSESVRSSVSLQDHAVLNAASSYFFDKKGKRMRPAIVLLFARSLDEILHGGANADASGSGTGSRSPTSVERENRLVLNKESVDSVFFKKQLKLAEITEMIHVASVLHDDVIDVADTRRGIASVNAAFGNQVAVLAGDFLLARASMALARLRNCDVVETLSTVIEHLVCGEILQMHHAARDSQTSPESLMHAYMRKTYFKTASLIAHSSKACVMLLENQEANVSEAQNSSSSGNALLSIDREYYRKLVKGAYSYGEKIGMAFQLVDDALDFSSPSSVFGKPSRGADLRQGVTTAPVLFALQENSAIREYMERKYSKEGDVDFVLGQVEEHKGVEKTLELAHAYAADAVHELCSVFPASKYRSGLVNLAAYVLGRSH
eukprot:CAMPEP_0184697544 /NCGR_PEP_ID=MMETSP0313-20130426/4482_1 /TAXON_ID=2792 /ORGANISM="Porphyridium aerugineum, Strain SAG 1380-2" /LENGTH=529 /DNA_ID=CAMNT_0027156357 /DNA_START=104 /DNA_END=1693 /DNA_ORIENTATION=+